MTGSDDSQDGSRTGRVLLVGALALSLGATGVLVVSDDTRFLRMGIVAALWAALAGAFIAARLRKQVGEQEEDAADLQSVYELELEREVAARREYELEVEAEVRRKAEEQSKDELEGLRKELQSLRETLEVLMGGEVLVERVALHAESTRMRSLPEASQPLAMRQNQQLRRITAAAKEDSVVAPVVRGEAETELIERVLGANSPLRTPQQPATPAQPQRVKAQNTSTQRAAATSQRPAVGQSSQHRPVQPQRPPANRAGADEWFTDAGQPPRPQEHEDLDAGFDLDWKPSWNGEPARKAPAAGPGGPHPPSAAGPPARRQDPAPADASAQLDRWQAGRGLRPVPGCPARGPDHQAASGRPAADRAAVAAPPRGAARAGPGRPAPGPRGGAGDRWRSPQACRDDVDVAGEPVVAARGGRVRLPERHRQPLQARRRARAGARGIARGGQFGQRVARRPRTHRQPATRTQARGRLMIFLATQRRTSVARCD